MGLFDSMRRHVWFNDVAQDASIGWRALRRRPAFTFVASLTLALGIGATTALFGMVKAVLLAPFPYGHPEGIAVVWSSWKGFDQTWLSYDEWEAYDAEIPAIADIGLFTDGSASLTGSGEPERLRAGFVQKNVFDILEVSPILGRGFTAEEDRPNGANVVVLGHALWQRRFGGDPSIVGKQIQLGGQASTVVGVMPAGFRLPLDFGGAGPTELWAPLATDAATQGATPGPGFGPGGFGNHGFYSVARLAPGATARLVNTQLTDFIARVKRDGVVVPEQFRGFVVTLQDQVNGRIKPALLVVFAAVGLVLLIACANVAGLLLVRGEARRSELAVRVALGASSFRLARQLVTESLVLSAIGGTLGVGLAALALRLVRQTAPAGLPRIADAYLDPNVLLFGLGVAAASALLAGLLPALQAGRLAPATELKEGNRSATGGPGGIRWRQTLVAGEVALAVVLVVGTGLLMRTVSNLFHIDPGFRPEGVLTMRLSTPSTWYPDSVRVASFYDELNRRVAAIPGVEKVGAARILPLATEMGDWGMQVEGYTPPPNQGTPGDWQVVTPGYFEAMGLRLVHGRFLEQRDNMRAPLSLVINRRFAEKYLAGRDPLGIQVRIGNPANPPYTIVGVVENVQHNALTVQVKPQFYASMAQYSISPGLTARTMSLAVKTTRDPHALIRPVRDVIRRMDPRLPVSEVRTMEQIVGESIAEPRFAMRMMGLFGALALVLSAIGIFGIVAQIVASRAREFGIRAALGAPPRELVKLSLRAGINQTAVGLLVGVVAALLLSRSMTGLLYGVAPADPVTFGAVIVTTTAVTIFASLWPARRAGRADPMAALHEG
ncbi:MAG: ABC transporter permease [Gemmatimonadetes bacterium]|nr:ABC transporter permease [Gemmatimonadota bacterium]